MLSIEQPMLSILQRTALDVLLSSTAALDDNRTAVANQSMTGPFEQSKNAPATHRLSHIVKSWSCAL